MSWNLFERIINAIGFGKGSEQPSDTPQSWPEDDTESPEASQEPSPDFQKAINPEQSNQWQD